MASSTVTRAGWLRNVLLTLCFSCFLFQFSIHYGGQGISANYLFVLSPLILLFFPQRFIMPSNFLIVCMAFYVVIFVFASFNALENEVVLALPDRLLAAEDHDTTYLFLRRFLSFASFCSLFVLVIINFTEEDMKCFFAATIVIS